MCMDEGMEKGERWKDGGDGGYIFLYIISIHSSILPSPLFLSSCFPCFFPSLHSSSPHFFPLFSHPHYFFLFTFPLISLPSLFPHFLSLSLTFFPLSLNTFLPYLYSSLIPVSSSLLPLLSPLTLPFPSSTPLGANTRQHTSGESPLLSTIVR